MKVIAESLSDKIDNLSSYENYFSEGDVGELRIYLDRLLYQDEMDCLRTEIENQGVMLISPIAQDARVLVVRFRKAVAPLAIIARIIVTVGIGIIGWQLFKESGFPLWGWILGGIVGCTLLRRKSCGKK